MPAADAKAYARQCALNAVAAAAAVAGGVDRLTGVVKLTGFVASVPEFTGQPGVINGASEVLGEIFGDAGRHARSAVGVPVLPLDSPVEVEVVFSVSPEPPRTRETQGAASCGGTALAVVSVTSPAR